MLTTTDIQNVLQQEYIPFFQLILLDVPDEAKYIAKPFAIAADLALSAVRSPRRIKVVIGSSPFILVHAGRDEIRITLNEATINTIVADAVFLDWKKMSRERFQFQVTMILEEFVHAFMTISNEELTHQVVAWLYKDIKIINGRYDI